MKQKFKWLLALVAMVASINLMAADPITKTYTLSDNDNGNSVTTDDVSWAIGSGAITASSSNMKLTGTITVTLPTGATLTKVEITKSNNWGSGATVVFASGNTTLNTFSGSGIFDLTVNKTDLVYTFTKGGNSSKNAWVKEIKVTYTVAAATKIDVTLSRNGVEQELKQQDSPFTLPTTEAAACDGWEFKGWSTDPVSSTTTAPEFVTKATATGTYYAVYGKTEGGAVVTFTPGTTTSGYFTISSGDNYASGTGSKINAVAASNADSYLFTQISDNQYSIKLGDNYITYSSSTNLGTSTTPYSWTISEGTNGDWRVVSETEGRALIYRAGSTNQFGGYSTSNVTATSTEYYDVSIGGGSGGTTTYKTSPDCSEPGAPVIEASDPTELAYNATSGEISYTITNPVDGKSLSAQGEADWISNIQVTTNKVTFSTSTNTSYTSRSAEVTLSYEEAIDKVITITQAGKPDERKVVNITAVSTNAADNKIAMGATANVVVTTDQTGFASYTYSTSDANIATVNESGVITGVAKGKATITASLNIADDDANYKKGSTTSKTVDVTVTRAAVEGELFYESFDEFSGTGGNDDKWSGSIASAAWGTTDNEGWTKTSGYSANQCAKFGAGSTQGVATTPEIDCQGAKDVTVTFKAGAWNNDSKSLTLEATNGTISQSSVTIANAAWTDCSVSVSNITGKLKITFKGNAASNSRFFLDEVSVIKKEVKSVSIKTAPAKVEYSANETFDPTGLEMTITYKDNTTKDVAYADNSDAFTFEPSLSTALTAANEKVEITLEGKTVEQAITVNLIETSLAWSASSVQAKFGKDDNVYPTLTVSPVGLEGVTYESSNEYAATIDADGNITLVAANKTTTITAKYAGVENIYKAATDASYTLEVIEATAPTFDIDPTEIAYTKTAVGETYSNEYFALLGENLTENVTFSITETDAELFSVVDEEGNPISSITPNDGNVYENIYIQYAPTSAGPHTAKLTITSGDAEGVVTLSGDAKNKYLVKWSINGTITATDNEYVLDGDKVTKVPEVVACTGNTFMGWTENETIEDGQEPSDLFKDKEHAPEVTADNTVYYAVYAVKTLDEVKDSYDFTGVSVKDHVASWETEGGATIKMAKGSGGSDPAWSNNEARLYATGSLTVSADKTISKIEYTYSINANKDNKVPTIDGVSGKTNAGTWNAGTKTWTGSDTEVTFSTSGSAGNVGFTNVTIYGEPIITYSGYSTSCEEPIEVAQPSITPSKEAELYFESITAEISCTTEGATIYYSIDGTEPSTEYESALTISETTTIKAIAKVGKYVSQEATATYSFGKVYASLAELVADGKPTETGEVVRVTLTDEEIVDFYKNKSEVKNGVKLMSGEQAVEIFTNAVADKTDWVIGGTLSGTLTCPWKLYNSTWELCPEGLGDLAYVAPKEPGVIAVTVGGTATHTNYVEGETFDPAGLTVIATYDIGEPKDVTELATWNITPSGTLTTDVTKVNVKATYSDIPDETGVDVAISVSAMQESSIADFISNGGGRCWLVGVVSEKSSNNFVLTDESGFIKIYGYSLAAGVEAVVNGDKIKVIASEYEYYQGTTHEAKNVLVIEKIKVPVTGVSIEPSSVSIKAGKTITLKASITPANATDKSVTWSIINDKANGKITIDQTGLVTVASDAADGASATVKVTTTDGDKTAECVVTVIGIPDFTTGGWLKITDASELVAGSFVIIAANEYNNAMKSYSSGDNFCDVVAVTKVNDKVLTYESTSKPAIFMLEAGKNENQWAFGDLETEKYLYAAGGSSNNYLKAQDSKNEDKASWTIVISDETSVASITAASTGKNVMSYNYNNGSPRFSCYGAIQGDGKLALYKYYKEIPAYLESVTISGTATILTYEKEQKFNPQGLEVSGHYSDNTDKTITDGITWTFDPAKFETLSEIDGDQSVDVIATVEGVSSEPFTVTDITVKPATTTSYELITDVNDLEYGDVIVLGAHYINSQSVDKGWFVNKAMDGNKYFSSSANDDAIYEEEEGILKVANAMEIYLRKVDGGWKMTTKEGMVGTTNEKVLVLDDANADNVWSISINEDGIATLSADGINYMKYNGSNPRFTTYGNGQTDIQIFRKPFTGTKLRDGEMEKGKMYSYCPAYDLEEVKGAIFYQPDYMDAAYVHFVEAKEIKAGYGYILEGVGGELKAVQVGEAVTSAVLADEENTRGMQGVLKDDANYDIEGENEGYQFTETSYSQALVSNNHLQYVGKDNVIVVGRAYLDLNIIANLGKIEENVRPGMRRVAINFGGQAPTNLNGLNDNVKAAKVLRDGQLYIIRDTKTYNAQGIEIK